jgi:hypothetical protein
MKDYTTYPALADDLPPLVRKQRRLEAQILALGPLSDEEKALRKDIDRLLVAAGIDKGDGVTCLGYDVCHLERKGTSRMNEDALVIRLIEAGMAERLVREILAASTEVGDPASWATVKPSKGSQVRARVATGKR